MTYPIPDEALDDRLAWIGTSGSGKTYNAGGGVEQLLRSKARVVIVDPLGVWYGLRLLADGTTPSPFDVAIFGGPHGDLPLNEHAGALLGETAATMAESCIIDLSELGSKAADRRFMTAFLETIYRRATTEPFHLVVDEADLFAPQRPQKGEEVLLGLMEQIVRRGRVKGFIPWLISQRPAVLNKNVLSQADGLIAFKLTSSQDRDAIDAWIEGQADKAQGRVMKDSLPTMQVGEGIIWIPGRGILAPQLFPKKKTFDSSRTPKRGEKRQRRDLKPLNLEKLKGRLASIEQEAKANDPKALKAEVARLTRELAAAQKGGAPAWPDQRELVATLTSELAEQTAALKRLTKSANELQRRQKAALDALSGAIVEIPTPRSTRVVEFKGSTERRQPIIGKFERPAKPNNGGATGEVPAGCAKPLATLAGVYPAGMTEAQWATAAGYKRTGGTWGAYKSRLKAVGMIEQREGRWFATETGAHAAGDVELPPSPGPDLVRWWAAKLPGTGRIAEVLIEAWPNGLSKDELADRVGMTATGGSFGAYLSRLGSPGLITRDGQIRLSEEVMGE